MLKKIALAASLALGTATAAYAACTHEWSCWTVIGADGKPQIQCGYKVVCR